MTAVNDAEASVDVARPLTNKQLGARVRELQQQLREKAEFAEALGRRIRALNVEREAAYAEAYILRGELTDLIHGSGSFFMTSGPLAGGGFVQSTSKMAAWIPVAGEGL